MITAAKFKIFEKYSADGDWFCRTGTKSEKECLDYNDWLLIDSMIQRLQLRMVDFQRLLRIKSIKS